jgi:hypothetical protein
MLVRLRSVPRETGKSACEMRTQHAARASRGPSFVCCNAARLDYCSDASQHGCVQWPVSFARSCVIHKALSFIEPLP